MQNQNTQQEKQKEKQKLRAVSACPRCGLSVSWFERHKRGNREYVYAVHVLGYSNKKRLVRKCYLGPVDSYEYVSKMHFKEGLEFFGYTNPDRVFEYLDAILDTLPVAVEAKLSKEPESVEKIRKLVEKMIRTAEKIKQQAEETKQE
jgi:hypothetical protein